jgi:uncharacterized protein (TIGR03435 family)
VLRLTVILAGLMLAAPCTVAQQNAGAMPDPCAATDRASFDTVSVRPSDPAATASTMRVSPSGIATEGTKLLALIAAAYELRDFQILGGPDWMASDRFDVTAKYDAPPDLSKLDDAGRKAWIQRLTQSRQSLLADRFHLKCHMETRQLTVYELVVAKGGPKFQETKDDGDTNKYFGIRAGPQRTRQLAGKDATMDVLAKLLSSEVNHVVLDKTGLTGKYDLNAEWAQDGPAGAQSADEPFAPGIFTAMEERLGLKLQPGKGPVRVLIIDRVDRPTQN